MFIIFAASRTCFVDYIVFVFVCLFPLFSLIFIFACLCFFVFIFVPGGQAFLKTARLSVVLETQKAGIKLNCQDSFSLMLACNTYTQRKNSCLNFIISKVGITLGVDF